MKDPGVTLRLGQEVTLYGAWQSSKEWHLSVVLSRGGVSPRNVSIGSAVCQTPNGVSRHHRTSRERRNALLPNFPLSHLLLAYLDTSLANNNSQKTVNFKYVHMHYTDI